MVSGEHNRLVVFQNKALGMVPESYTHAAEYLDKFLQAGKLFHGFPHARVYIYSNRHAGFHDQCIFTRDTAPMDTSGSYDRICHAQVHDLPYILSTNLHAVSSRFVHQCKR